MVRNLSHFLSKRLKFLNFIGSQEIKDWIPANIIMLEKEQLVLRDNLTAEQSDLVKEEMIRSLVDEILEHGANLKVEDNKYTISLYLIKRD